MTLITDVLWNTLEKNEINALLKLYTENVSIFSLILEINYDKIEWVTRKLIHGNVMFNVLWPIPSISYIFFATSIPDNDPVLKTIRKKCAF